MTDLWRRARCALTGQLSRSLTDAAAEAVNAVILAKCPPNIMPTLPPECTAQDLGEGAVVAVLETLAAGQMVMSDEFLRRLAAEVKEGTA